LEKEEILLLAHRNLAEMKSAPSFAYQLRLGHSREFSKKRAPKSTDLSMEEEPFPTLSLFKT
jgi:hypothetical protein